MRAWLASLVLASSAAADDGALRLRLDPDRTERWLHLDETGISPSMFATGGHDWHATAELSHHLGPFRVGMNASVQREGDVSHRVVGLFAYRTFRLSRWMHAWIVLGLAFEQLQGDGLAKQGVTAGFWVGTTFR